MSETVRKVIIVGGSHHNTLGVVRSLGRKGLKPYVIITTRNSTSFVLRSKYIEKGWTVEDSDMAVDLLMEKFTSEKEKPVLIACHDIISSIFDVRREELLPYFEVPGSKETGRVTFLMDKKRMGNLAAQVGLHVPDTIIANESKLSSIENLSFPCITKPVESRSGTKGEIIICNNRTELQSFLNGKNKDYIIQQFVDKKLEFQLIGCSLDGGNDIIIPGVSKIIRQEKSSNTGFLHYTELDDTYSETLNITKSFIKECGYSGLFSVEFLRDQKGVDYFMEINFRNDGNAIAVTNAGVNLPYIWFLFCSGQNYNSEILPIHNEWVMPEFAELLLLEQKIITWGQWHQDMKKATSYMDYAVDDLNPTEGWRRYNKEKYKSIIKRLLNTIKRK